MVKHTLEESKPDSQPPQRSLSWHLSYLREHMHGTTEFRRCATVAMHFAQCPHLYAPGEVCRLYVEDGFFGLTLRDYLGTMAQSLEHWAWVVAAMTPAAWDVLLSLWADIGAADEIERRCYEAALMYAWVPGGGLLTRIAFRRVVQKKHGHVELWIPAMAARRGVVSYVPQKGLTGAQWARLLSTNPGWARPMATFCLLAGIGARSPFAMGGDDFPAFAARVVRDPNILGIVEVSP